MLILVTGIVRAETPAGLAEAQRLAARGQFEAALTLSEELLARGDRDPVLRRLHADLLAWTGRLAPALEEYAELRRDVPEDPSLRLAVALAHQWQGDLVRAEDELARLVEEHPEYAEAGEHLGRLRSEPRLPLARAVAAAAQAPTDVAALRELVDAAVASGELWQGEAALERALRLAPTDPAIRALREEFRGRRATLLEERIAVSRAALAAAPGDAAVRTALAEDLSALGRLREAADEYAELGRNRPDERDVRLKEARLRSWAGQYRRSLALYDGLIAGDPADHTARVERARLLSWDGQLLAAARALDRPEDLDGSRATAYGVLGDISRWEGRRRRAAGLYRRALDAGLDGEPAVAAETFLAEEDVFSSINPHGEWFSASDDFTARRFGGSVAQQAGFATRLEAQFLHVDYEQRGADLSAERPAFTLAHEWGDWRGTARLGLGSYSSGDVTPAASLEVEVMPQPEQQVGIAYDRYDLIDEVTAIASAIGDVLQADRGRVWFRQPLPLELRLSGGGSVAAISDGNRAVTAWLALARRIVRRPRIELRLDARYYALEDGSPRYWSPADYVSSGLGFQLEQPLVWGLRLLLEGRGGFGAEEGSNTAEVTYAVGLTAEPSPGWQVVLNFRDGITAREGGYRAHLATLDVRYRFGTGLW